MAWFGATGVTTGWSTPAGVEYRPTSPVNRDAMAAFLYRFAGSPAFTPPATSPFLDVRTDNMYYREITWLRAQGISTGWTVAGGVEFRPLEPVNRDAMAAFLHRFAGSPPPPSGGSPFTDVAPGQLHGDAMRWLAAAGVSQGWEVEPGRFEYRPLQPVNRDAMATFLERLTRIP
ncbi:S-layer homology domain-containing protein [Litorihabitans aurantiacus]|uniref:SLH domain-containing protein n=1 Tax=Litorihabitans aurantiacus TaxID=1930061 RepID=A0AA38CWE9_9MICO|nr:S-layer homology domain-containing protein [Litorihabitans aurantiacus]GMA33400.1 hypothetical protein GCM10025875_33920 [Litorihabitans aurantiacus]